MLLLLLFDSCFCMLFADDLQQTIQKEDLAESLFREMEFWITLDDWSDEEDMLDFSDRLELWRKAHKLEKKDMTYIFVKTIQDYYSEREKKSENEKLRTWHFRAMDNLAYYPPPQKQFMDLIEKSLKLEPDSSLVILMVFGYMEAYPNWIFDDKPMIEIMNKCNSNNFKLSKLCSDLITQFNKEKNEIRKKKLLDKAFEWAFQGDKLEIFHFLDRILLDHYEKEYAVNPSRKLQLQKELEMYEKKEYYNWVYRRTKYALEHFGEGDEAFKTLLQMDTDPKLKVNEWDRSERERRWKEEKEDATKQRISSSKASDEK